MDEQEQINLHDQIKKLVDAEQIVYLNFERIYQSILGTRGFDYAREHFLYPLRLSIEGFNGVFESLRFYIEKFDAISNDVARNIYEQGGSAEEIAKIKSDLNNSIQVLHKQFDNVRNIGLIADCIELTIEDRFNKTDTIMGIPASLLEYCNIDKLNSVAKFDTEIRRDLKRIKDAITDNPGKANDLRKIEADYISNVKRIEHDLFVVLATAVTTNNPEETYYK